MKAFVTEQCIASAEIARRACGGHGYSNVSISVVFYQYWSVGRVVEVLVSITRPVELDIFSQRLATFAMFFHSLKQTLSRGDGPRHSLHASA